MEKILPMSYYYRAFQKQKRGYAAAKRSLDIVFSIVFLVALSPLFLILMAIAALDTKSSPVFVQERMGRFNRPFKMLKIRTMSSDAPANVATHKLQGAEGYISRTGRIMRKLSLDELPQLINILKGDMSFVGPRPVVLTETDLLDLRTKNRSCLVRPGLTGWAQVNGRDNVTVAEKARLDAEYVQMLSFRTDARVLVKTVSCVLESKDVREGANPAITAEEKSA